MPSKTKTKPTAVAQLPATEESKDFKRKRMLQVRREVANAVKNGKRVDLMGYEGTDIARSQIALQDLLDSERKSHAKARGHIIALKDASMMVANILEHTIIGFTDEIDRMTEDQVATSRMLDNAHDECHRLATGWQGAVQENYTLKTDNEGLKLALKGVLRD